jgi:hypothetical protein
LRKLAFPALIALVLVFMIPRIHPGLGFRSMFWASAPVRATQREKFEIRKWLDRTPPNAPTDLSGGLTPTIVAETGYILAAHSASDTTASFDSTGGDLILMAASTHDGAMLTPDDTYHNTWISLAGPTDAHSKYNVRSQMWYAKNPKVGPDHAVTMTLSSPQSLVISVIVVKGADTSDPLDGWSQLGDDNWTMSPKVRSPSIQTRSADDLLVGFAKCALTVTWDSDDAFTFHPNASSGFLVAESGLALTPGYYQSEFSLDIPSTWESAVIAVKPAAERPKPAAISLAWRASIDNVGVAQYRVERCEGVGCNDFAQIGTSTGPSFVDLGLAPSKIYRYRVRAVDLASNIGAYSNVFDAPTDVSAESGRQLTRE